MKKIYFNILVILFSTNMYAQIDSLVAFYPFNGDASEELGSGIDGINHGSFLTTDRFGNQDSAFLFLSDYPSYIDLGDSYDNVFTGIGAQFSFSFWIDPYENMLNKAIISKYGNSNCGENGREFSISVGTDAKIVFINFDVLNSTNDRQGVKGSTDIVANFGWKHIIITYDGTIPSSNGLERIKIYLDGVQEITSYATNEGEVVSMKDGDSHLGIGLPLNSNGDACGDFAFDGKIDDIKLFNKVLSISEVQELFNEPNPMLPVESIIENYISKLNIYPNPVVDELHFDNINEIQISVLNLLGNQVISNIKVTPQGTLNLRDLINGAYILKVQYNEYHGSFIINKLE